MNNTQTTPVCWWGRIGAQAALLLALVVFLAACAGAPDVPAVPDDEGPLVSTAVPTAAGTPEAATPADDNAASSTGRFLSEPFLQLPTADAVRVVWFTDFEGSQHTLTYTSDDEPVTVEATTTRMTRMYEDADSTLADRTYSELTGRDVWRHEAVASDLQPDQRVPYTVASTTDAGNTLVSAEYTLQPLPSPGTAMQILLTSDQQNRQMSAANFQQVADTVGMVDAVFFAGDLVDYPHRASEWFDRFDAAWLDEPGEPGEPAYPAARPAFFPAMQGTYQELFPEFPYTGGPILQHAPLFGTIGNHEVPGRWRPDEHTINEMDNDPQPRWYAEIRYEQQQEQINPEDDPAVREQWIRDNSYEFTAYREMWSHPDDGPRGEEYYAYQIGDVFLISMNVSRVWRNWEISPETRGKFTESAEWLNNPDEWGFGDMWFETFDEGSQQYAWLVDVLESEAFQNARYQVVMGHQNAFGLGDNVVPALADRAVTILYDDAGEEASITRRWPGDQDRWERDIEPLLGSITEIRYAYPVADDVWKNDIEPLLLEHGVDLVLNGHSHVWNRAEVDGMHYLETSNVGNTFGAYYSDDVGTVAERASWASTFWEELESDNPRWDPANYPKTGDIHGREPIFPTEFNPMAELDPLEENNRPLPFVSSNNLTVFSILDTARGTVSSYVFDTRDPTGEARLFDQFVLGNEAAAAP
jgi:hypothetical protein